MKIFGYELTNIYYFILTLYEFHTYTTLGNTQEKATIYRNSKFIKTQENKTRKIEYKGLFKAKVN